MKSMDKLTTGVAYGTSAGSAGYWFLQLLDKVTPSQWAAIGVLGSLWICPYISRHLLSLNPLLACCRRYSRGER